MMTLLAAVRPGTRASGCGRKIAFVPDDLIVESDDKANIENFMQPFKMAGSVEIIPASTCETVVERAGC